MHISGSTRSMSLPICEGVREWGNEVKSYISDLPESRGCVPPLRWSHSTQVPKAAPILHLSLSHPVESPWERPSYPRSSRNLACVPPLKPCYKRCLSWQALDSEDFRFQFWAPNEHSFGIQTMHKGYLAKSSKSPATFFQGKIFNSQQAMTCHQF